MADSAFFKKQNAMSVQQIAEIGQAELSHDVDPNIMIEDVAPLDVASANQLSFFDNVKYKEQFSNTKAGACFASSKAAHHASEETNILISDHPYKSYALVAQAFYPQDKADGLISDNAYIHKSAKVGAGTSVAPSVVIEENAVIGKNCVIEAGAVVCKSVSIGDNTRVGQNAVLSHAKIGSHVTIYRGACIGQDGFGFAIDPAGHVKVPQLGRVIIEDHVEIGANTTIDRGAGPDTVIGQGTWIDNLVQIGHNVKIGRGCVIVAQTGISGSTVVEDFVSFGGQSGITGHLRIGKGAQIGAQSGVMRDVPAGDVQLGSPAAPIRETMRQIAALKRLIK